MLRAWATQGGGMKMRSVRGGSGACDILAALLFEFELFQSQELEKVLKIAVKVVQRSVGGVRETPANDWLTVWTILILATTISHCYNVPLFM